MNALCVFTLFKLDFFQKNGGWLNKFSPLKLISFNFENNFVKQNTKYSYRIKFMLKQSD